MKILSSVSCKERATEFDQLRFMIGEIKKNFKGA